MGGGRASDQSSGMQVVAGCIIEGAQQTRYICAPVQRFDVESHGPYNLIWCQWLLMYITDQDCLRFLCRARKGLAEGGVLVVKENITSQQQPSYFENDKGDPYCVRPKGACESHNAERLPMAIVRSEQHLKVLFASAGLRSIQRWLQDFGDSTTPMTMNALVRIGTR